YSPDYVAYAVAQYTKFGKPPIVPLLPLEITAADNKISIANEPHHHARLCPLAWLPMSVQSMRATRSNQKPVHALLSDLIGTRDLSHPQDQGHGAGAVYGVLPDPHTLTSNKDRFKSLFTYWEGELESQRPALSAQLPSFEAVRSDAIGQQIARRTIARPIIQRIDEIFSEIDSVARGAAGPDALAAIANTKTTDLLLGLGQHHRVRAELPRLAGSCAFAAETSPDVVRWALDLARGAGAQHETAESLRACVSKILRREPELVRPVFDFLAGCLSPDALLAHLNRCIAEFGSELTTKQRRRFADVIRLYGDYHSASEFLEQLRVAEKGEKADDRPIRNRISSALLRGRPLGGSVRTTQESERHKASLPNEERLRHALADLDHQGFQSAFRARYAEKECLLSVLDPLRSSALDIAGFAFRPDEIPYHFCRDGEETAIMAQIFGDLSTLGEAFDQPIGHLSALIGSCLGDDTPLISILSDLSSVTGSIIPQPDGSDSNRLFDAYLDIKAPDTTAQHGMVSVIMSTLDTEPALMTRSIRSLLQQSYQDFEIIVIDDGSAPHLAAEVRRLEELDQRIRCFAMPRNLGPYLCRNFALSLTRGSFVAIQDADDVSHPQRLEHQVAVMSKNSDVQLVTSDHLRIDPRGWPQFEHGFKLFGDGTMSSLFRREVFHRLGPFLKVRSRGDVEFRERIRRCLGAQSIQHIGFPLLLCHASAQTLSQRTVSSKGAYLQLFRGQIDAIRPHRDLIERGCMPDIAIPVPLQG
ncbi:MAG: glycosyltransferase family A protein, partial [Pseudomonadota bacterium]